MLDFCITKSDFNDKADSLNKSEECKSLLDSAILTANACFTPNYVKQVFSIVKNSDGIDVLGTSLTLKGNSIKTHLLECDEVAIICATVGSAIDREIEKKKLTNLTEAYLLDLCGSVAVEKLADRVEDIVREEEEKIGKKITCRFSCGYGDFPLETQGEIIDILNLNKVLGIRLTSGNMMVPFKSVTAVIGIGKNVTKISGRCVSCPKQNSCKGGLCSD